MLVLDYHSVYYVTIMYSNSTIMSHFTILYVWLPLYGTKNIHNGSKGQLNGSNSGAVYQLNI